jgi:F0F1-type ATP synthase membrane subunit c/vacuolar-type H+-ATPase subunit K
MALRTAAKWVRGISRVRFMPLGGDNLMPSAKTAIGGTGPFDFTAAHSVISAVPITIKVDNGAEVNDTIDLHLADEDAVTAADWVAAVTAAAIPSITASVDANGRAKLVYATGAILQAYGLACELAGFGQGLGQKYVKSNTVESVGINPTVKADTTYTTTPADGVDIEVIDEGYKKGVTGTVTDTAQDYEMMRLFEGGVIDSVTGAYTDPSEESVKPYFMIEIYNPVYGQGSSKVSEFTAYEKTLVKSAVGAVGNDTFDVNFRKKSYTFTATNYKPSSGISEGAVQRTPLTIAAYNALVIDDV